MKAKPIKKRLTKKEKEEEQANLASYHYNRGLDAGISMGKEAVIKETGRAKDSGLVNLIEATTKAIEANAQALTAVSHMIDYLGARLK